MGVDCLKSISEDGGVSWSELADMQIPGCHRPVAGLLQEGAVLMTYHFLQGTREQCFGDVAQSFFGAVFSQTAAAAMTRRESVCRIFPIDDDGSRLAGLGYSGWLQFADGEIYAVNYIVDDVPEPIFGVIPLH